LHDSWCVFHQCSLSVNPQPGQQERLTVHATFICHAGAFDLQFGSFM